jgi:hypothetical protein
MRVHRSRVNALLRRSGEHPGGDHPRVSGRGRRSRLGLESRAANFLLKRPRGAPASPTAGPRGIASPLSRPVAIPQVTIL